jgi:hypothetical protein
MAEDHKDPPRAPQLVFRALRDLTQSPIWQQQQEKISQLREKLPRYTSEELQQLQRMLETPQLPDVSLPPDLAALLREQRQELEQEERQDQPVEICGVAATGGVGGLSPVVAAAPPAVEQPEALLSEQADQPAEQSLKQKGSPPIEIPHSYQLRDVTFPICKRH